jgi:hypothetical protein
LKLLGYPSPPSHRLSGATPRSGQILRRFPNSTKINCATRARRGYNQNVVTGTTVHRIATFAREELIVSSVTIDLIIASVAPDRVVAGPPYQGVRGIVAADRVVPGAANDVLEVDSLT